MQLNYFSLSLILSNLAASLPTSESDIGHGDKHDPQAM